MVFLYKSSWLHLFIIVFYYWDTLGGFWGPWMDFSTGAGGPKCLKWLNKMTTERMKMFTVTQNDYLRQKSGTKKKNYGASKSLPGDLKEKENNYKGTHTFHKEKLQNYKGTQNYHKETMKRYQGLFWSWWPTKDGWRGLLCLRPGGPLSPNPNILGSLWNITVVLSCSSTQWDQKCHKLCKNRYEHSIGDSHQRSTCTRAWRAALSALLSRLHWGATPVRVRKWNLSGLALARTRPSYALCQHGDFRRESVT